MSVAALAWPRAALLAALVALAALAAAVLVPPASAAPPPADLALTLSLIEDSDNIVPPGSTLNVAATLTYETQGAASTDSEITINSGSLRVSGNQEWETTGRSRLDVNLRTVLKSGASFEGRALHKDTLAISAIPSVFNDPDYHGFYNHDDGIVLVFDANGGQLARIDPPTAAGASAKHFGRSVVVWQENDDTAWVFIGSVFDSVPNSTDADSLDNYWTNEAQIRTHLKNLPGGQVWIYKIDRRPSAATPAEQVGKITPKIGKATWDVHATTNGGSETDRVTGLTAEGIGDGDGGDGGAFGASMAITSDGSTLLVGNPSTSRTEGGAVWVFTKPSTGWDTNFTSALTADATNTGTPAAARLSDASSNRGTWTGFGYSVAINDTGKDWIVVGALFRQRFPSTAGQGSGTTLITDSPGNFGWLPIPDGFTRYDDGAGSVHVFKRPAGGSWTGAITSTTADLFVKPDNFQQSLGGQVAITANGNAIAATATSGPLNPNAGPGFAVVWNKPAGDWGHLNDSGYAKLTHASGRDSEEFSIGGVSFNSDGTKLAVGNPYRHEQADATPWISWREPGSGDGNEFQGEVWLFSRGGSGWSTATTASATKLVSPSPANNAFFGRVRYETGGDKLLVSQFERHARYDITGGAGAVWVLTNPTASNQSHALIDGGCDSRLLDRTKTWSCGVHLGNQANITIPLGTPEGTFSISATLKIDNDDNDDRTLTATLPITIGTVNEADHAEFGFAENPGKPDVSGDEEPYDSEIPAGGSTQLQLKILSSENEPAGANSVGSLLFTTTSGTLRLLKPAGAATGTCALTCQVDVRRLNAGNSGDIVVELTHPGPGKSGTATVRAQVLPRTGGSLLEIPSVAVTFSGAAAKLAVSEPTTGVLNVNTATGANDDAETRDRLRFSVSATDASGNKANVPASRSTRILDPEGKVVWSSVSNTGDAIFDVAWPLTKADGPDDGDEPDNDLTADGKLQVELDVDAPNTAPLKNGEYTLEVTAGTLKATQTFTVSGGPETIVISEPDSDALTIGGRFTLTATLSDADGAAVPDGTPVKFAASATGALPVLVKVQETAKTKDGQASVTYEVVAAGRDSVRVSSGEAGEVRLITTTDSAPVEPSAPANPADSLSQKMPNDYSTWLGEGTTTASALLDGLGEGFRSILFWYEGRWLRYAVSDGRPVPSSMNFEVPRGAILWLSNGG